MKKLAYIALGLCSVYLLFMWDYHVSKMIFNRICSDPARFGLHIYERVQLDDDMVEPIPETSTEPSKTNRYYLNDSQMVNPEKFQSQYKLVWDHSQVLSRIGPITTLEARIERRSDGKTLANAILVRNQLGWLSNLLTFGYQQQTCPDLQPRPGYHVSEPVRHARSLVQETFFIKQTH